MTNDTKYTIEICNGTACSQNLSRYTHERATNEVEFRNLKNVTVDKCGCLGDCKNGPNVRVSSESPKKEIVLNRMKGANMGETMKQIAKNEFQFQEKNLKKKKK